MGTESTSRETESRVQTVCLLVIAVIATGAALQALGDVMIPFALAMFLAIALAPVVDWLSAKTRLSRPLSVAMTMVIGVLLLAVLGGIVASSIAGFEENFISADGDDAEAATFTTVLKARLGAFGLESGAFDRMAERAGDEVEALWPKLAGLLGGLLSQGVTILIFLMFLLIEQGRSGSTLAGRSGGVGDTVRERVKQYISVKVLTSAVTGLAVGLSLWAIGVPAAQLFGLLTFLLNFIPTIGSVIAVALPIPLLIMNGASVVTITLALAIPGGIQFAAGQVWENKLLGDKFDLRASVVLLALVFWGKIWGIVGMLLATPITAVLKTLMESMELTRPIARVMGQAVDPPDTQTADE